MPKNPITKDELQKRWDKSWQAHQDEIDKFTLIDKWMRAYEKHIRIGESWNEAFRFPELHGAVLRKYDNLVEYWPEMKAKGEGDEVIALQKGCDHQVNISNLQRERNRAAMDAIKSGFGVYFLAPVRYEREVKGDDGKWENRLFYDGLGAERIDPRDFIPAYSALQLHDHTGQDYCPYVFRRRVYYHGTFLKKYSGKEFKNIDKVQPTSYSGGFTGDRSTTEREGREKESGDFVVVLEYWDQENDILEVYAGNFDNKIFESPNGIPYSHKQLPFHMIYNYRRSDSIYGVGEIEINMPYNLFRESLLNLLIDNARLELQPAYVIAGDVNFNSEETELQPGAIFTLRGNNLGKVQDTIMPFKAGSVSGGAGEVMQMIENSRITVTGDDTTSLYANPQQLATQTLAKREALQKRTRAILLRNAIESEFYAANQIISYLKHELSEPYKDEYGKTTFRKISVQGYSVIQDKKESKAEFKKIYGADDEFFLNKAVAEDFKNEIEIVSVKLDDEIKRDKMEKQMMFFQSITQIAQFSPQLLEGLDFTAFLKENAKQLSMEIKEIFPPLDKKAEEIDTINAEHDQIALGVVPDIKPDEDSMEHFTKHTEFKNSAIFKKLPKKAQDALNKHLILTIKNVQEQKANPGQSAQAGLGSPPQVMQQAPVQGMAEQPGGASPAMQGGGAPIPSEAPPPQSQGNPLG